MTSLALSRKERPCYEVLCEVVFRPAAQLVVRALLPLRVPPPAVVLASAATGLWAAALLWRGAYLSAALVLQLKTVLDNADGQLARAANRVTVLGRYLDSESDFVIDAALLAALGHVTGQWALAAVAFFVLATVLSFDFGLELAWRREHGQAPREARPAATGLAAALAWIYDVIYTPQDRLVAGVVARQTRGAPRAARLRYHDRLTLNVLANFGLSSQLAVLGVCLALASPVAYLWYVIGCGVTLLVLLARRGVRVRSARA